MSKFRIIEPSEGSSPTSRAFGYMLLLFLAALVFVYLFAGSLFVFIPIDKIGVKKVEFGPSAGLVKHDFGCGYNFGPAFFCTWYILPANIQSIDMLRTEPLISRSESKKTKKVVVSNNDIKVKTTEGYDVSVDISLKYRIKEGCGWQVIETFPEESNRILILTKMAKTSCNEILGQMATEDFFNPEIRIAKANKLKDRITSEFDRRGILLIDVLIRDFLFDPTFEDKIKEKKLADQDVELNKSQTQAAEYDGETRKVQAETQSEVTAILEDGAKQIRFLNAENDFKIRQIESDVEKKSVEMRSDADLYYETTRAKSQLVVKNAEAAITRLRTNSLESSGAANYVAVEIIRNLNFSDFKLSSQKFNPLDVEKVIENLTGK